MTIKKEKRSLLNTRKLWERSTKVRNIIRKALMSLKVGKCDGVGYDTHVVLHLITS